MSVGCWSPIVLITYDEESLNVSVSALSLFTQAGSLYNAVCFLHPSTLTCCGEGEGAGLSFFFSPFLQ